MIRPEDLMSEHESYTEINGIKIRKATMGATMKNVEILASPLSSVTEKASAKKMIEELSYSLVAVGLLNHVIWKNSEVQEIFENTQRRLVLNNEVK